MIDFLSSLASSYTIATVPSVDDMTSAFTPPPNGLTNLQSKVIGPFFTATPLHQHPSLSLEGEMLPRQARIMYQTTSSTVNTPTSVAQSTGRLSHDSSSLWRKESKVVRYQDYEDLCALAVSMGDVTLDAAFELSALQQSSTSDGDAESEFHAGGIRGDGAVALLLTPAILDIVVGLPSLSEASLAALCVPCALVLPVVDFGHRIERRVSAALWGSPCCFNILNAALVNVLRQVQPTATPSTVSHSTEEKLSSGDASMSSNGDSSAFSLLTAAAAVSGMTTDHISSFTDTVQRGAATPAEMEPVWLFILSNIICRPIVVCDTTKGESVVYLPTHTSSNPQTRVRPVVLEDGQAVIPTDVNFPSDNEKCRSRMPLITVPWTDVLPPNTDIGDYVTLAADGGIVLNGETSSLLLTPLEMSRAISCEDAAADATGSLSFSSFPASFFTVSRRGILNEALEKLASTEDGEDVAATAYLQPALVHITNVCALKVDGDGHCLLHSVSRSLVGKTYLWHALRHAVHQFLLDGASRSQLLCIFAAAGPCFSFLADSDGISSIEELTERAHPDYPFANDEKKQTADTALPSASMDTAAATSSSPHVETKKTTRPLSLERGLGLEHIFVLSCILRRPILLLDSPETASPESFCSYRCTFHHMRWSRRNF